MIATYQAQSIAMPIKAKMEYSSHEKGGSPSRSRYIEPSRVSVSSVSGSYSAAFPFRWEKIDLTRSMV
jgi:hypothetical protein